VRAEARARLLAGEFQRGATLLLRDAGNSDDGIRRRGHRRGRRRRPNVAASPRPDFLVTAPATGRKSAAAAEFLARDFFQTTVHLPFFAGTSAQAATSNARFLIEPIAAAIVRPAAALVSIALPVSR